MDTHRCVDSISALPQGPSLRFGLFCPDPSSFNRPHQPHSQTHPDFTFWAYTKRLRFGKSTSAVHDWFRAFTDHSLLTCRPQRSRRVHRLLISSSFADDDYLHLVAIGSTLSIYTLSGLPTGSLTLQPANLLALLMRTFTSGLSAGWSPFVPPGITTMPTG